MEIVPMMAQRRGSDNPKGGELDLAVDGRTRCKKNSSVLSCIDKRTKEGCDRDSAIRTVHNRLRRKGPIPPRRPGKRKNCRRDFVSR